MNVGLLQGDNPTGCYYVVTNKRNKHEMLCFKRKGCEMISLLLISVLNGQIAVYPVASFNNLSECNHYRQQIKTIKQLPHSNFSCVYKL